MSVDTEQVALAQALLARGDAEGRWLRLLEALLPVGVADMNQLQAATGFSRDQINRLLEKCRRAGAAGPAVLTRVADKVERPWLGGRGAHIYRLGELGAALLRAAGHQTARPCGLKETVALAHALAVLEVRLAAQAAGRTVETETEVRNAAGQVLRPDNLVLAAEGPAQMFEVEQTARPELLRRIVEGIRRRARFFADPAERPISPTVRVLWALPRGAGWERSVRVWEKAVAAVAAELGGTLPMRLVALPLDEFLAQPDWGEPPEPGRWLDLQAAPSAADGPAAEPTDNGSAADETAGATAGRAPVELLRYTPHESRLVLEALWEFFLENARTTARGGATGPAAAEFFRTMNLIYQAGHGPQLPLAARAEPPRASWFLLAEYLKMHPSLRAALLRELERSGGMVWNASTMRLRLQAVANVFLGYHGWRTADDAPLWVCAELAELGTRTMEPLSYHVQVREPALLVDPAEGEQPTRREVAQAEQALAWVLRTVALEGERVGLRRPAFA